MKQGAVVFVGHLAKNTDITAKGVIKTTHGNKGCLRVHFEKGMPGQSLGTKVRIENGGS